MTTKPFDASTPPPRRGTGRSTWITFADMMSLLLTFFIVMLAASSFDPQKVAAITDNINQHFGSGNRASDALVAISPTPNNSKEATHQVEPIVVQRSILERLSAALALELDQDLVDIERQGLNVVVRFPATATFDSGSDELKPALQAVVHKIAAVLKDTQGEIRVSGHADDQPISTYRFRSNWELSAARAVSVVHLLLRTTGLDARRIVARGYGESRPATANDNTVHRHENRRVEIEIAERVAPAP